MIPCHLHLSGHPLPLGVLEVSGTERLGEPYVFDLLLEGAAPPGEAFPSGALALGQAPPFHGVLVQWEPTAEGRVRARLVPRLWLLSLARRERTFLHSTLAGLLGGLLGEGAPPPAFECRLEDRPLRAHLGQHGESTLELLGRWCGREGVTYAFRQEADGERVIFMEGGPPLPDIPPPLPAGPGGVMDLVCRVRPRPGDEAGTLRTFEGRSEDPALGPGASFALEGHFRPALDGNYLVVGCRHEGGQGRPYVNHLEILAAGDFHPDPGRPAPGMAGVRRALAGPGHPDGQGLREIRLPWQEPPPGPLRLPEARPSGGGGAGWRFPQEAGAEVALGYREGDPDRPVILGSLPGGASPEDEPALRTREGRLMLGRRQVALATDAQQVTLASAEGCGGAGVAAPAGHVRWWAGGDTGTLTRGMAMSVTAGASWTTSLLQQVNLSLGPRVDLHPGWACTDALGTSRWVLGTETTWAARERHEGSILSISAMDRVRDLKVLARAAASLGALAASLAGSTPGVLESAISPPLGIMLAYLADRFRERPPLGPPRDISMLMSGPVPLYLGSLWQPGSFLALGHGASPRRGGIDVSSPGGKAATLPGWRERWYVGLISMELVRHRLQDGPAMRPAWVLATPTSALGMSNMAGDPTDCGDLGLFHYPPPAGQQRNGPWSQPLRPASSLLLEGKRGTVRLASLRPLPAEAAQPDEEPGALMRDFEVGVAEGADRLALGVPGKAILGITPSSFLLLDPTGKSHIGINQEGMMLLLAMAPEGRANKDTLFFNADEALVAFRTEGHFKLFLADRTLLVAGLG